MRINTPVLLAAAALAVVHSAPASAAAFTSSDDSWVAASAVAADATIDRGLAGKLSVATNPVTPGQNRITAMRFEIPAVTGPSAGSSLSITLDGRILGGNGNAYQFDLYGVIDGAAEDDMDEATYSPEDAEAIDQLGNNVAEPFIFDATPGVSGSLVLDSETITGDPNGVVLTFSGVDFDTFVSSVSNDASDGDIAFVLTLRSDSTNDALDRIDIRSNNFAGTGLPTLNVVPEPSALALAGLGALTLLRRRRAV